jgi:hypothetical protein
VAHVHESVKYFLLKRTAGAKKKRQKEKAGLPAPLAPGKGS